MAVSSTYYLDAPSLSASTAVFLDPSLSSCAPDGFYSDGVIAREQVSCALLPEVPCPSCPGGEVYYVDVHSAPASALGFDESYDIYYTIDAGSPILITSKSTDICELVGTVTVPYGSTVYFGILSLGVDVKFNASDLDDCSGGGPDYCGNVTTYAVNGLDIGATYVASLVPQISGGSTIPCP